MANYDFENLENVRAKMSDKFDNGLFPERAYRLIERGSSCDVVISDKSGEICADILMSFI